MCPVHLVAMNHPSSRRLLLDSHLTGPPSEPAPTSHTPRHPAHREPAPGGLTWDDTPAPGHPASRITPSGADWLTSAAASPHAVNSWWRSRPEEPETLPCGTVFDVVSVPALFGRGLLERLWSGGPGSGPVAAHRGRLLLFAAVGTAGRLPALLRWEEWGGSADACGETIPPLLCHGLGDAVTVPPPHRSEGTPGGCRWLVAPEVRRPWLPGPEVLLWAYVRTARARQRAGAAAPRP